MKCVFKSLGFFRSFFVLLEQKIGVKDVRGCFWGEKGVLGFCFPENCPHAPPQTCFYKYPSRRRRDFFLVVFWWCGGTYFAFVFGLKKKDVI